ncbi:MAG: 2-oxo acid dehydrogenase subunit E2 [Deltaproteobacteria bacterium]|nr:2-oxo acid dehydrogenase subunit E2 [Deltaproteobacteria bacterium]
MKLALTMPQFGESITEALIVRWLKKEGESVREMEPLMELETEKSVFSYESPFNGKLVKILESENKQVKVGVDIAHFEVPDEAARKYLSLGIGKVLGQQGSSTPTAMTNTPRDSGRIAGSINSGGSSISVSPAIRALAKEKGVSLEEVSSLLGTGPGGRLTKEDFIKYLEQRGGPTSKQVAAVSTVTSAKIINVTPIRARIAEKMILSKREIPHAGTGLDVDVTSIDEWRKKSANKLVHLPFILLSVIKALRKYPVINSSLKGEPGKWSIEEYEHVHLGIATSTPQGLMVPVLRNAQSLSFQQIVDRGTQLIEKARTGRLDVSELTGGTFTVNNTGALGAVRSSQIIPHPQSAILAANRVTPRPWVVNNEIKIRSILSLDLSFDHRLIDGDAACGFLTEVKKELEGFDFSKIG